MTTRQPEPTTKTGFAFVHLPCDCGRNPMYFEDDAPHRYECQSRKNLALRKTVIAIEEESSAAAKRQILALSEALDHTITHAEHFECAFVWCVEARAILKASRIEL